MQADLKTEGAALAGSVADRNGAMAVVIVVIVLAGLLGGAAARLAEQRTGPDEAKTDPQPGWTSYLVLGVTAAACVPLFLSLLKSALIGEILERPSASASYGNYLVFGGLCLVAAFSAKTFIQSISKQLMRDIERAGQAATEAKAKAANALDVATEANREIEGLEETAALARDGSPRDGAPEDEGPAALAAGPRVADEPPPSGPPPRLSEDERRVLQAMRGRTYRTATGIAEDSGIAKQRISELLDQLVERKLVIPTTSRTTGGRRWALGSRGLQALD